MGTLGYLYPLEDIRVFQPRRPFARLKRDPLPKRTLMPTGNSADCNRVDGPRWRQCIPAWMGRRGSHWKERVVLFLRHVWHRNAKWRCLVREAPPQFVYKDFDGNDDVHWDHVSLTFACAV